MAGHTSDIVAERRAARRQAIALTLQLSDGSLAVTQNVSSTGLCLRLMPDQQLGNYVRLSLTLAKARLTCIIEGNVVRRELVDGEECVAIQFMSTRLEG